MNFSAGNYTEKNSIESLEVKTWSENDKHIVNGSNSPNIESNATETNTIPNINYNEEKRLKNLQASIRFRVNRKHKTQDLQERIESANAKIAEYKSKVHKLEIENACLRKMLLGNWKPEVAKDISEEFASSC